MTFAALSSAVRTQLGSSHRYAHVLRVARLAGRLAARHGADANKARTAGMLHDLARLYSADRLIEECQTRGIAISEFERSHPIVLHAQLGAALARERFGVEDDEILSAIAKHTLAAAEMSRLDEIVYVADGLEPGRAFPAREILARLAFEDLDAAVLATLKESLAYLRSRGLQPAAQTLAAIETYERRALPPTERSPRLPSLLEVVREAALDKKAEDVVTLPLEGRTIVADAFVVATGRSKIQTRSIADAIAEKARENGHPVARVEGYADGGWILLDLGTIVAHVFTPEQRAFYNLERLWGATVELRRAQNS